jgi:uncharacterized protein (TIGR02996 family)
MAEHPGLMQAIIDAPDDDAPRLIYADWLDDQGEALRAEFIRLHCRWGQLLEEHRDPYRVISSEELRQEHRDCLLAPLVSLGLSPWMYASSYPVRGCRFHFRRGLVEEIEVNGEEMLTRLGKCVEQVFERTPLRRLQLVPEDIYSYDENEGRSPLILGVLRAVVGLPRVAQLRELSFSRYRLGDAAARALLDSPYLRPETRLIVENHRFQPKLLAALRERFGDRLNLEEDIPF